MSDIPSFPYALLWGERVIVSVANLTRQDGEEFLALAPQVPVRTGQVHPLEDANEALESIRDGSLEGAAVLEFARAGWRRGPPARGHCSLDRRPPSPWRSSGRGPRRAAAERAAPGRRPR